jgi:hypothetical protein
MAELKRLTLESFVGNNGTRAQHIKYCIQRHKPRLLKLCHCFMTFCPLNYGNVSFSIVKYERDFLFY